MRGIPTTGSAPIERTSFKEILKRLDEAEARDAGMSLNEWMQLPEPERKRITADIRDEKFAKNYGKTLAEYRAERRGE
jgi:hypothetical protein